MAGHVSRSDPARRPPSHPWDDIEQAAASSGNRGVVTSRNDVLNQHDEVPITIDVVWLIATRQSRS